MVEDHRDFATALSRQLAKKGLDFVIASSAIEARARFADVGPSAWSGLVVDPGLPEGIDAGIDFLAWCRPLAPGIPAVCVSGQLDGELITKVNRLGVQFVTKIDTVSQLPWFLERVSRYTRTRAEVVADRAARDYGLTPAETTFVASFLRGETIEEYKERQSVSRSAYDKFRRSVLDKTGDADHLLLAIRLWRLALDRELGGPG
ncbi:MAG: response regulator [Deltaproteobacteria bacterium]|nr:response regulator [Deltaproteobacteria bacterium]